MTKAWLATATVVTGSAVGSVDPDVVVVDTAAIGGVVRSVDGSPEPPAK